MHIDRTHRASVIFLAMLALSCGAGLAACVAAEPETSEDPESIGESSQAAMIDHNIGSALGTPVWSNATTCGMVDDYTPSCTGGNATDTAFYWVAPSSGTYTFSTIGSAFDTVLHVYDLVGGGLLGCNDNSSGTLQSTLALALSANQGIAVVVDGYGSACGNYKLNITASAAAPPATSLKLWLRADAGVTLSNSKVSSWADQSGNNNTAYMPTAAKQPSSVTGALNGKPVIRFSGAQSLSLTNVLSHSQFTVFVAGKNSQPSNTFSMILGPGGNNANNQLRWESGTQALLVGTGNNFSSVTATIGDTKVYHALSAWYDGSKLMVYRDGNLKYTKPVDTSGPWNLNQIGAWFSSYFMVGDVAEVLFYSSALSESDRTSANSYLKSKYALP